MNNSTNNPSQTPSHLAYHIRNRKSGTALWTRIGTAWQHADGKGFNIELEAMPLDGRISLRVSSNLTQSSVKKSFTPPVTADNPKSYYREEDGHTYYIKNGILMACPTFASGAIDLQDGLPVEDFDEPLTREERQAILAHLTV